MRGLICLGTVVAAVLAVGSAAHSQAPAPASLPYTAVHDPQFVSAADAAFMHDDDRLIGITIGNTAKAYAGAILSQHGLVEDQSPDGPIAITW